MDLISLNHRRAARRVRLRRLRLLLRVRTYVGFLFIFIVRLDGAGARNDNRWFIKLVFVKLTGFIDPLVFGTITPFRTTVAIGGRTGCCKPLYDISLYLHKSVKKIEPPSCEIWLFMRETTFTISILFPFPK